MNKVAVLREALEKKLGSPLGQNGQDVDYPCPFCEKLSQTHKLHVNYDKGENGVAICHGPCGYKTGDLTRLIRDLFGGLPKNLNRLIARARLLMDVEQILNKRDDKQVVQEIELPESFMRIPYRGTGIAKTLRRYLDSRGFNYDDIDKYGLGYFADEREKAYGYVIFPYYMGGKCVYWQGRCVEPLTHHWPKFRWRDGPPKNYNPPGTGKKSLLYGYDQALGQKTGFAVEGPLDAIAWGPGGLGLTSKHLHEDQIRAISLLDFDRIIVCLDGPKADGSDDTWNDWLPVDPKRPKGKKMRRPLLYAYTLRRRTNAEIGVLRLPRDDPAEYGHDRIHAKADRHTKWLPRDLLSTMKAILAD